MITPSSYPLFENELNLLVEQSKKSDFLTLERYIKEQSETNPRFLEWTYSYLGNRLAESNGDFFERIIGTFLKLKLFTQPNFSNYFASLRFSRQEGYKTYHGFSHICRFQPSTFETIINNLKTEKGYFAQINCEVIQLGDSQGICLIDKLVHFLLEPSSKSRCYLIYEDSHYKPLFAEKTGPKSVRFFITDSLGTYQKDSITTTLERTIELSKYSFKESRIYLYCITRLKGLPYGCGIFSLRDIVQISRDPATFIQYALESAEPAETESVLQVPYYEFLSLPEKMMKLTTFITQIQEYDQMNNTNVEKLLRDKGKLLDDAERPLNIKMDLMTKKYVLQFLKTAEILTSASVQGTAF
jgi:hypothetical protein